MSSHLIEGSKYEVLQGSLTSIERYLECPICLGILEDTHIVPACQHRFCGKCIQESLRKCNNECPTCRAHVSTKRSLRTDDVFDSLVKNLFSIIKSSQTNENGAHLNVTIDSLKALSWHFLCPVCDETLTQVHISSECLHRFCVGCIGPLGSRNKCPCCEVSSTNSTFSLDKQFDEIVVAVEQTIASFDKLVLRGANGSTRICADIVQSLNVDSSGTVKREDDSTILQEIKSFGEDVMSGDQTFSPTPAGILNSNVEVKKIKTEEIDPKNNNAETEKRTCEEMQADVEAAKYPRGTLFMDSTDRYGRVVGFDGCSYQIYYPKTGHVDVQREADLSEVKIIQPHKRPMQKEKSFDSGDNVPCCPKCKTLFSSNPHNKASGCLPIQSQKCSHVICIDCVQSMRMSSCSSNSRLRATVDCPICKKPQSFNGKDPTICLAMCEVVSLYNKMEAKRDHETKPSNHLEQAKSDRKRESSTNREDRKKRQQKATKQEMKKKSAKNMKCMSCSKEKHIEKFSSKQLKKGMNGDKVFCRRCEEKGKIQSKWGSGFGKYSTTISVAKTERSKPSFLTTVVPWCNGYAQKQVNGLPANLTIYGYSRESFSRLSNEDLEQEAVWTKSQLWSTGDGIRSLLRFLHQEKKSAYGTFLLPNGKDGFFVIPFDQTPPTDIFICKYVIGLGVTGSDPKEEFGSTASNEGKESTSTLRKLLAAEYKTSQSLDEVPKGSVAAKKYYAGPVASSAPPGRTGSDWFRERIVIKDSKGETSEEESSDFVGGVSL